MSEEIPEVWIEVKGFGHDSRPVLLAQFYREQSLVRGDSSIVGSDTAAAQKERIVEWSKKTRAILEAEGKEVFLGGDFNLDLREEEKDPLGKVIVEELTDETGLEMIIEKTTHQEIRAGRSCKQGGKQDC